MAELARPMLLCPLKWSSVRGGTSAAGADAGDFRWTSVVNSWWLMWRCCLPGIKVVNGSRVWWQAVWMYFSVKVPHRAQTVASCEPRGLIQPVLYYERYWVTWHKSAQGLKHPICIVFAGALTATCYHRTSCRGRVKKTCCSGKIKLFSPQQTILSVRYQFSSPNPILKNLNGSLDHVWLRILYFYAGDLGSRPASHVLCALFTEVNPDLVRRSGFSSNI